jgi:hypothetical protein
MNGGTNQSNSARGKIEDPDCFNLELFKLRQRMLSMDPFLHAAFSKTKLRFGTIFLSSET